MSTVDEPIPPQDLSRIVGYRFVYTYANAGPTYPIYVVPEFAYITLFEHVGADDESVIDVAPDELPPGWADRTN